jgi:tape measure domain-containing protein
MPTSSERLAILIEANTKSYENAMKRIEQKTNQAIRASEKSVKRLDTSLKGSAANAALFAKSFAGAFLAAGATQALTRAADSYTRIENALKVAGFQGEALKKTLSNLEAIAKRQAAPIEGVVRLYSRMATVQKDLGVSSDEMLAVTEGVAAALKIQGTSAQEASGSLTQLAQAFGGGIVRAEEFNSVLEGMPTLAQAVANNIDAAGGSIGKLRQLVVDGKVTSQDFFRAIRAGSADLKATASTMDQTLGQALTNVGNAFVLAVGEFDNLTGASGKLVSALEGVAVALRGIGTGADWTMDRIRELNDFLASIGLIDVEARNQLATSGPGSMVSRFVEEELKRRIQEMEQLRGEIADQISELNFNIDEGFVQEGHLDAARKEVKRLQEQFNSLGGEIQKIIGQMTSLAAIRYDPLSSIRVPGGLATADQAAGAGLQQRYGGEVALVAGQMATDLIKKFEGFISTAKWDVNAFRTGFGSDTTTSEAGVVSPVTAATTTTEEAALRDLNRRIGEFQAVIVSQIGSAFGQFTEPVQAALTSVAYNYGRLPASVAAAARTGDTEAVAKAVESLSANPQRRAEEAAVIRSGQFGLTEQHAASVAFLEDQKQAAAAAADEARQKQEELTQAKADFEAMLKAEGEAIKLEISNIGKSTAAQEYANVKQELTNQLTAAGIPITEKYAAAIEDIANARAALVAAQDIAATNEQQSQEKMQEATAAAVAQADEIRNLASDVIGGLVSDLANGVKPAEALANALGKIAQKLIDIGVNALVSGLFGPQGSPLGGIFGSLFGGGAAPTIVGGLFHKGGIVGQGGPSRAVPASAFVGAPRYHSGGVAGFKPGEVPAILKRGELVVPVPTSMRPVSASRGGGGRQHVSVENTVRLEPSPLFAATVESRAQQAEDRAVRRAPGHMANLQQRRLVGSSGRG